MIFVSYICRDSEDRNCFGNAIVNATSIESENDIREIESSLNKMLSLSTDSCVILNWKVL